MRIIKLLVLLVALLELVGQQGATGDWTNPQNEATTANATAYHHPTQYPSFFSKANLKRIIMQAKISCSRTNSYLHASQTFHLSLLASHNITTYTHRSLTPHPSHPTDIAHNAAQMAQNRLDEIAAIASLAHLRVEEVPWLALRLEGWARRNADMDLYEDFLVPATMTGCYWLLRALIPPTLPHILAIGELIFIEKGISSRHPEEELRHLKARSDIMPWMTKEFVIVDRTSYDVTIKECKTTTTHGVFKMPLCFFAENVTEAGWVGFRLTWSAMVIGAACIYCKNRGWRDNLKALLFFVVVYLMPEITLDLTWKAAQLGREGRRG